MIQLQHIESQEGTDSAFGRVFTAYSTAFKSRDREGIYAAFQPGAVVRVHDHRTDERL